MAYTLKQLHPLFAAELIGADLKKDPSPELVEAVTDAMAEYAVVVLRDQFITDAEQIRFSRKFGPLELPPQIGMRSVGAGSNLRISPEMYDVSNLDVNGDFLPVNSLRHASNKANEDFHTDSSFNGLPTKWSILSGRVVPPEGGDTWFVDTRAVYDALSPEMKQKVEPLVAEHYFWKTRSRAGFKNITDSMKASMPPVQHPVVRVIPESSRKALYIGHHMTHIVGWPRAEGEAFIEEINAFAAEPRFVYAHKWREGDLVLWDNRCTIHKATSFDLFKYKRDMRRTTINEYGPEISSTEALGVEPAGSAQAHR
jgi:alpha-ketoglutarate-dependent 2,4-dichlorophenoxyacetate dioxygenase